MVKLTQKDTQFVQDHSGRPTKKQVLDYVKKEYKKDTAITRFYNIRSHLNKTWVAPASFINSRKKAVKVRQETNRDIVSMGKSKYESLKDEFRVDEGDSFNKILFKKIAFLQYVSGRRIGEILNAEFKMVGADKLMFIPAKTKEKVFIELHEVLFTHKLTFMNKLREMRAKLELKNEEHIKRDYTKWLRTKFDISSHTFRGWYIAYLVDYKLDDVSESNRSAMRMKHLNHTNMGSTIQYARFKIIGDAENEAVGAMLELSGN